MPPAYIHRKIMSMTKSQVKTGRDRGNRWSVTDKNPTDPAWERWQITEPDWTWAAWGIESWSCFGGDVWQMHILYFVTYCNSKNRRWWDRFGYIKKVSRSWEWLSDLWSESEPWIITGTADTAVVQAQYRSGSRRDLSGPVFENEKIKVRIFNPDGVKLREAATASGFFQSIWKMPDIWKRSVMSSGQRQDRYRWSF